MATELPGKDKSQAELINFYEQIIAAMPGHVYWKNRDCVLLGCNDRMAKHGGLNSRDEIVGKTDYEMPWKNIADFLSDVDREIMEKGQARSLEEVADYDDGRVEYYITKKVPLRNRQGEVVGLLGISFDITEQKLIEKQNKERELKEIEKANEYARKMKTFAGSIAHELRTPIASIKYGLKGALDYFPRLIEGYQKALDAGLLERPIRKAHLRHLEQVIESSYRQTDNANHIIDLQLKNISLADVDSSEFISCSITTVINDALGSYPLSADKSELIHWQNNSDFNFRGDAVLLKHVIWNLLKNAIFFIEATGKGDINIWLEQDEHENRVHIKDTAKGMTKEHAKKIFDEFVTNRDGGIGLGLTFCKIVMQAFGGNITCETEENKFADFILHFPK